MQFLIRVTHGGDCKPTQASLFSIYLLLVFLVVAIASPYQPSVRRPETEVADATPLGPLSTISRWIVDSSGKRVKLRCINWAGHMELNVPEGLSHHTPQELASIIADHGFNCVRLTYSTNMALTPDYPLNETFKDASQYTKTGLKEQEAKAKELNPWFEKDSVQDAFAHVVTALDEVGIRVILDNHVSRPGWCCNTLDGNGWWASGSKYIANNSRFFNTEEWLEGLHNMALWSKSFPNIVGMSLRNELRAPGGIDTNSKHTAEYFNLTSLGAQQIHAGNPDLLIVFGGTESGVNLSIFRNRTLDKDAWGGASKTVYEAHIYPWTEDPWTDPDDNFGNCTLFAQFADDQWGYLLTEDQPYTGPVWLSEFGLDLSPLSSGDQQWHQFHYDYLKCVVQYMERNDADWAYWALQGSYYVRENITDKNEEFGILISSWKKMRNPQFAELLGGMWNLTQGPT